MCMYPGCDEDHLDELGEEEPLAPLSNDYCVCQECLADYVEEF